MKKPPLAALLCTLIASFGAVPAFAQSATLLRTDSLRAEPYSDSRAVAEVPLGGKLQVIERKGTWANAEYRGQRGWLRALNLRAEDAIAIKPEGVLALQTGRAAQGGVAIPLAIRSARVPRHALVLLDDILRKRDTAQPIDFSARFGNAGDLELELESPRAGYAYIFAVDSHGRVLRCLFPNALGPDNELAARRALPLPGTGWRIESGTQPGEMRLLALVAAEPLDLFFDGKQPDGPFFKVEVGEENHARLEAALTRGSYAAAAAAVSVRRPP